MMSMELLAKVFTFALITLGEPTRGGPSSFITAFSVANDQL